MPTDIWYMLQKHGKYVYHYTSASTLNNFILPEGTLRFSRFEGVNDPREFKNWRFDYSYSYSSKEVDALIHTLDGQLNGYLKHSWRLACFVSDPFEALITKEREDRGEDIIHAPYDRGHSKSRMWAQYGDNYKGACLIFDKDMLDQEIKRTANAMGETIHAGLVTYRNPRIISRPGQPNALTIQVDDILQSGANAAMEAHLEKFWPELFFLKSAEWAQEREFRWLVSAKNKSELYVDIRNSLVGIALGSEFPSALKPNVGMYAKDNGTSLAEMNWANGFPQPILLHWRMLLNQNSQFPLFN